MLLWGFCWNISCLYSCGIWDTATFRKYSSPQEICSMKPPIKSTLDPRKDVNINNTQHNSVSTVWLHATLVWFLVFGNISSVVQNTSSNLRSPWYPTLMVWYWSFVTEKSWIEFLSENTTRLAFWAYRPSGWPLSPPQYPYFQAWSWSKDQSTSAGRKRNTQIPAECLYKRPPGCTPLCALVNMAVGRNTSPCSMPVA